MERKAEQNEQKEAIEAIERQFPEELSHLRRINEMVALEVKEAERSVEQMEEEQKDLQRYMIEHRNEGDAKEMFQAQRIMSDVNTAGGSALLHLERLKKVQNSPYFARIDFVPEGGEKAPYYIGLYAFRHQKQLYVIDWRSPVASMFYDFETGPAAYTAPTEHVEGEIVLKRQFKIARGELEFAFDSSQNIQDDILQQELAHTSDEKMKSIISTIQKEQNRIIRDEEADVMIIQGVAGSGKTSIALHRVAFLLYRFRDTIKAENVTIISPNKVFGDYISGVLPELGEEPIFEASLEDLALVQIEDGVDFIGDKNPLEYTDAAWTQRVRYKGTAEFVKKMDEYIELLPQIAFQAEDYVFGDFSVPAQWIVERIATYRRFPLLERLSQVADDIYSRLENEFLREEKPPHRNTIFQKLKKMLKFKTTLQAYKGFYQWLSLPKLYKPVQKGVLEWNDVYPYLYLQSYFTGVQTSRWIKHLVIDEMQDYTPIQYAVLNRLFPCPKTILGDFGQSINPNCAYTLQELHELYEGSQLMRLEKSYRSTYEIIHFAKAIAGDQDFQAVERHGEAPSLFIGETKEDELERLSQLVEDFHQSSYNAMAILTRTNPEAQALYDALRERGADVSLITPESKKFQNGALVLSIQMSKGLEFDEVAIPYANEATYHEPFDRNLLYVACTRAMHKLVLTCSGKPSHLFDGKPGLVPVK